MTHSPEIDKLAKAIRQVQKAVKPVRCNVQDRDGKWYADVNAVREELGPHLWKAGLIVLQGGSLKLTTRIIHVASMQFVEWDADAVKGDDGELAYGTRHALMQAFFMQQALPPDGFDAALEHVGVPGDVYLAFQRFGLSKAQMVVIARSGKTPDQMIAEAERIGGRK